MDTKRLLRRQNLELKQKLADIESELAENEGKNARLTTRLEEQELTITSLKQQKTDLETMLRLQSVEGSVTRNSNNLANAFHYYDLGNNEFAKQCLSIICDSTKDDRIRIYKYTDRRHEKEFFFLAKVLHYANLKGRALLVKYRTASEAEIPVKVYNHVQELKASHCQLYLPNIPEIQLRVDEYLVMDDIEGPTLFDFFIELEKKPDTQAKKLLIRALLKKQLRDNAFIGTRKYSMEQDIIIISDHEQKLLENFEEEKAINSNSERESIMLLARPLNRIAKHPFRDGASWNHTMAEMKSKLFLSDEFIFQKKPDRTEIEELVQTAVWSVDFETLRRLTFQQDDTIHALEWLYPNISEQERRTLERYSIKMRFLCGDDVSQWHDTRALAGFYRHIRTNLVLKRNSDNYPDPGDLMKQHHLGKAYATLHRMAFGSDPDPGELLGMNLRRIVELAILPRCQEKAMYITN